MCLAEWTHRDSHPDLRLAEPASSCWTMSPKGSKAEAVRLELATEHGTRACAERRAVAASNRARAATCFRDRLLIQPDHFRCWIAKKSSGGWNRTNDLLVQSQASLPTATTPDRFVTADTRWRARVRGEGFEPATEHGTRACAERRAVVGVDPAFSIRGEGLEPPPPGSKPGSLPLADPRSCFPNSECPAGVEPTSPAWKAGTFAARPRARERRERELNPQGFRSTVFKTAAVANRLVPPSKLRRQESNPRQGA